MYFLFDKNIYRSLYLFYQLKIHWRNHLEKIKKGNVSTPFYFKNQLYLEHANSTSIFSIVFSLYDSYKNLSF